MTKLSLQSWRARPQDSIALFPSVYTMAYATGAKCLKLYGAKLKSAIFVIHNQDMNILMESQADYQKFSRLLVAKFKKQPHYLENLLNWSEAQLDSLRSFIDKNLGAEIISALSNEQIAVRYLKYVDKYLAYHLKNTPAWWLGALAAEEELKKYLQNHYSDKNVDELLTLIIEPLEYQSENKCEELALLDLAANLRKFGFKKINQINELPAKLRTQFLNHVFRYSSLPFGYKTGLIWSQPHFLKALNVLLKNKSVSAVARIRAAKLKIIRRDQLVASLKLPLDIKNLVVALRQLAYLQELKKTTQTRSHPTLQLVVKPEIARRLDLRLEWLDYLDEQEIAVCLRRGVVGTNFKKELAQRIKSAVVIISRQKASWLTTSQTKQFMRENGLLFDIDKKQKITGQIASGGLAQGRVKICRLSTEIHKIKTGDILVSAMTTPDFVPAMRKAAAIITDEGGITSHAAIVARELRKPCIIGTKLATRVLHDGDLVEVDANRGIIKILAK
jgi:phosphohistidine swiveling domain-containing protein